MVDTIDDHAQPVNAGTLRNVKTRLATRGQEDPDSCIGAGCVHSNRKERVVSSLSDVKLNSGCLPAGLRSRPIMCGRSFQATRFSAE